MDHLGLGIEINMIDGVTMVSQNIVNSFNNVENAADHMTSKVHDNFQQLESLMQAGEQISQWGEGLKSFGEKGVEGLFSLGEKVIETSGEFDQMRIQLESLYHSASKGDQMFAWAQKTAMNYPVTLQQLLGMIAQFQGAGLDIQHTLKDNYMALNAITDLYKGMHKPGETVQNAEKAFTEIADVNNWTEMSRGFQIGKTGVQETLSKSGHEDMAKSLSDNSATEEAKMKRLDAIMTYMEMRFGNVTQKLAYSWSTLVTNFQDIWQTFLYDVGKSNFFPDFIAGLFQIHNMIVAHRSDMEQLGKVLGQGFDDIWKVIQKVLLFATDLVLKFTEFSKAHPHLAGIVIDIIAITSVLAILAGGVLIFAGQALTAIATMGIFALTLSTAGEGALSFGTIIGGIATSFLEFLPIVALVAGGIFLLYKAWDNDFMGLRTKILNFVADAKNALQELWNFFNDMSDPKKFAMDWNSMGESFGWVKAVVGDFLLLQHTINQLMGNKDSADLSANIKTAGLQGKADEINKFVTNVNHFFTGLGQGIQTAWTTVIQPTIEGLSKAFGTISGIIDTVARSMGSSLNNMGTDKWQLFGQTLGYVGAILVTAKIAESITAIATALGLLAGSSILGGISKLGSMFKPIVGFITAIAEGLVWVVGVIAGLVGLPELVVGAIIVALVALGVVIATHWEDIKKGASDALKWIQDKWNPLAKWFTDNVWTPMKKDNDDYWGNQKKLNDDANKQWKDTWNDISKWWKDNVTDPMNKENEKAKKDNEKRYEDEKNFWKGVWLEASTWWKANVTDPLKKQDDEYKQQKQKQDDETRKYWEKTWNTVSTWWTTNVTTPLKKENDEYSKEQQKDDDENRKHWEKVWNTVSSWWNTNVTTPLAKANSDYYNTKAKEDKDNYDAWNKVWNKVSNWWQTNVIDPLTKANQQYADDQAKADQEQFDAWTKAWAPAASWFTDNVINPIVGAWQSVSSWWSGVVAGAKQDIATLQQEGASGQLSNHPVFAPNSSQGAIDLMNSVNNSGPHHSGGAQHAFAKGTDFAPGGLALVGEEGPELVNLPRGSQVHTARETESMLGSGYKPVQTSYNTNNNTTHHEDKSITIQQLTLQMATQAPTSDPKTLAEQVLEELKRLQVQQDMFTYAR